MIEQTIELKTHVVYNWYQQMYKSGCDFEGFEEFEDENFDEKALLHAWGEKEIDSQYYLLLREGII